MSLLSILLAAAHLDALLWLAWTLRQSPPVPLAWVTR